MASSMIWRAKNFTTKLTRAKPLDDAIRDAEVKQLRRALNWADVTAFGLGEIIGAGIFVVTGVVARLHAGPAVIFSYLFAGIASIFSALCYAEFAARVPTSGSAYTYAYVVAGEWVAFIIGWDLTLEYMVAAAAVARGWSGYLVTFLQGLGLNFPTEFNKLNLGIQVDPTAAVVLIILTMLLIYGVKDSSRLIFFWLS
eukprot:TRINITY_DN3845_c0_g2_i1.p2 TRINITY_DN3845_c0_g2~~TRINITY_DN3845_c0_g2_i1.p2  ORF type:complete len:198 (-),score=43.52 TRINITY_DN3845_c0_g2_i1:1052-1645(-)